MPGPDASEPRGRANIAYAPLADHCPCPALPDDGQLPPFPTPADWPKCENSGGWHIGDVHFVCDAHMRRAADEAGWDWDELMKDAGRA